MARRIVHQLVDDLDGTVLEIGEGETVLFSLDGVAYEIDLTADNAVALRDALAPYIGAARSVSSRSAATSGGGASSSGRKRRRSGQQDYTAIREWAKANGHQVSERGRVPASVLEAYEAAH
ncbi:Lsr2 family protein [Microbacterium sp. NPDC057407]|uniref:histone-like nucleoid-structuring protein Lsr2 n=1 Tax=Microbacterium sp. NPDC057407 TaxID=3346120 RepID=UPI00366AEB56